jgi:hypothetical protein
MVIKNNSSFNPYIIRVLTLSAPGDVMMQAFRICVSVHWGTSFHQDKQQNHWSTPFTTTLTLQECMEDPDALMRVLTRTLSFEKLLWVDCSIGTENEVDHQWLGKFYGDMGREKLAHTLYYKLFNKEVGVLATMHKIDIPRHTLTFMVHSRDALPY